MSNSLALATVTATVGRIVGEALHQIVDPSGVPRVRFGPPHAEPRFVGCTIFVYRVAINALRRTNAPPAPGHVPAAGAQATLDADYLFAFSGEESTLEPQRFLGGVVSALHARPLLAPDAIRQTIAANPVLNGSNVNAQVDAVRFTPKDVDLQTLSALWSTFGVPYTLSMVYMASAILIDT